MKIKINAHGKKIYIHKKGILYIYKQNLGPLLKIKLLVGYITNPPKLKGGLPKVCQDIYQGPFLSDVHLHMVSLLIPGIMRRDMLQKNLSRNRFLGTIYMPIPCFHLSNSPSKQRMCAVCRGFQVAWSSIDPSSKSIIQ